jgi:dCTP diphosphatase
MLAGVTDLTDLRDGMRRFSLERDWERFHDPKSLVLALVGEVGELAELFQWLPAEQARDAATTTPLGGRAADELSDILLYLLRLADVLDIDLGRVAEEKLAAAGVRYPAAEVRGVAPGPRGVDRSNG